MAKTKNHKEYYCCLRINSGLSFQLTRPEYCCYGTQEIDDYPSLADDYFGVFKEMKEIRCRFSNRKIHSSVIKVAKSVLEDIVQYVKNIQSLKFFRIKYLIIPYINDNIEEIDRWFDLIVKNGS